MIAIAGLWYILAMIAIAGLWYMIAMIAITGLGHFVDTESATIFGMCVFVNKLNSSQSGLQLVQWSLMACSGL